MSGPDVTASHTDNFRQRGNDTLSELYSVVSGVITTVCSQDTVAQFGKCNYMIHPVIASRYASLTAPVAMINICAGPNLVDKMFLKLSSRSYTRPMSICFCG